MSDHIMTFSFISLLSSALMYETYLFSSSSIALVDKYLGQSTFCSFRTLLNATMLRCTSTTINIYPNVSSTLFFDTRRMNLPQCLFLTIFVAPSSLMTKRRLSTNSILSFSISPCVCHCERVLGALAGWYDLSAIIAHVL